MRELDSQAPGMVSLDEDADPVSVNVGPHDCQAGRAGTLRAACSRDLGFEKHRDSPSGFDAPHLERLLWPGMTSAWVSQECLPETRVRHFTLSKSMQ